MSCRSEDSSKCSPKNSEIKETVRNVYGNVAEANSAGKDYGKTRSCCGAPAEEDVEYTRILGYSEEDTKNIPKGANMGLGCGNPSALAELKPGETVLDLGSGGGFDCFLAAGRVGPSGKVIGVDMTPSMVTKARRNAEKGKFDNVEFRLGEIEYLPLANDSVDVVISNCVINLATDKQRVFQEIARVLKKNGRLAVSDIVAKKPMTEKMKKDLELYAGCIAGALSVQELEENLKINGFRNIRVNLKEDSAMYIDQWTSEKGICNYVLSANITAIFP